MNTEDTGIDIYLGSGGAPEGVLAAAALRCIGGQMQGKLILDTDDKRARALKMGVTDGSLLSGVRYGKNTVRTNTVVMRSWSQTVRWITAEHRR